MTQQFQTVSLRGGGPTNTKNTEHDGVYEDAESLLKLRKRNIDHINDPSAVFDMDAKEFYQAIYFSKVDCFLTPPELTSDEEKERVRDLYSVDLCSGCGAYKVALKKNGKQVVDGRRVLICGGCGLDDRSLSGGEDEVEGESILKIVEDKAKLHKIVDATREDDSGSDRYVSAEEDLKSSEESLDSPERFLKMLDATSKPTFLPKRDKLQANADARVHSSPLDDSQDRIYGNDFGVQMLQHDLYVRQRNPDAPKLGPKEFYALMHFSKVEGFLAKPTSIATEDKVAQRTLYDIELCEACRNYKVVLKESSEQITHAKRVLMCGGC